MLEGGEHLALESLVMKVQGVDIFGRAAAFRATDSGQDGFEKFFSQNKQCGERSDSGPTDSIAASVSEALDQCFAA